MSVTIDSLDIQIKSSAGSAAKNIEKLAAALGKLNANAQVTKATNALGKLDKANNSVAKSTLKGILKVTAAALALSDATKVMTNAMKEAVEWEGITFRFGRAFGEEAEVVYEHVQKISDALKINKQEFMQYSSLYGSLLSGFGMEQDQASTIAVGLTELSYDIWAANNDRYQTIEDAAEALRSAITGEIEPARNAGIDLSNAALQEYLDTHTELGLKISEMTGAQKAEVRYAKMVNDAMNQGIVGEYAGEMDTAEGVLRTLNQQLKTLGHTLGSFVQPILKEVIPWVSAFVELITEGVTELASILGITIQEIQWGDPDSMNETANGMKETVEAAKELKRYMAGFDELNVIGKSESETDTIVGGSLGLDYSTLWNDSLFEKVDQKIDDLKPVMKDLLDNYILPIGAAFAAWKVTGLVNSLMSAKLELDKLGNAQKTVLTMVTIVLMYNFISEKAKDYLSGEGGIKSIIEQAFGAALGGAILEKLWPGNGFQLGLAVSIVAIVGSIYAEVSEGNLQYDDLKVVVENALAIAMGGLAGFKAGGVTGAALGMLVTAGITASVTTFAAVKGGQLEPGSQDYWLKVISDCATTALSGAGIGFKITGGNAGGALIGFVVGAALSFAIQSTAFSMTEEEWNTVKTDVSTWWDDTKERIGENLKWENLVLNFEVSFASVGEQLGEELSPWWDGVKKWFSDNVAPKFTLDYWKSKFDVIKQAVTTKLDEVKSELSGKWATIKKWFSDNVAPKFTLKFWTDKFKNLKEGFTTTIKNMLNAGIDLFNEFVGWVNSKLSFSWEGLTLMGKQIYPGGSVQLFTIPQITQRFASGGFIEDGLFTMNHGEIAGKFSNGQSVVANNQQIVAGIASGVETANENLITAFYAMGQQIIEAINAKDTATYIDTKRITAAQTQRSRAYGV